MLFVYYIIIKSAEKGGIQSEATRINKNTWAVDLKNNCNSLLMDFLLK